MMRDHRSRGLTVFLALLVFSSSFPLQAAQRLSRLSYPGQERAVDDVARGLGLSQEDLSLPAGIAQPDLFGDAVIADFLAQQDPLDRPKIERALEVLGVSQDFQRALE